MREDDRIAAVKHLLFDYVRSPSLRHIRDRYALMKLAQDIVRQIDRGNSIWRKWDGPRETLLKSAIACWIPIDDLRDFLNQLPGPALTTCDVAQRLRAFEEEEYGLFARDDFRAGCLALYEMEKAEGTELPAIIQMIRDHVEAEEERLRTEQRERYRQHRDEERAVREQRLRSGADCPWTQLPKSPHWFCRINGRTYRLSPSTDKKWNLFRVQSVSDDEKGALIGKYQGRGDATKVVKEMAYQPEPRW